MQRCATCASVTHFRRARTFVGPTRRASVCLVPVRPKRRTPPFGGILLRIRRRASAAAIATVLAALTSLLAALAGILGLLAGLLTATLLLAGALLPALLLLMIATLLLTRVLWILAHVYTPVAQPLTGEGAGQSLRRLGRLSSNFPMPGRLTAVKRLNVVGIRMVPDNICR